MTEARASESGPQRRIVPPWVKTLVGVVVSLVLLVIAGRNVDLDRALEGLARVDFPLYALSMVFYLGTMVTRALLVDTLLAPHGRVGLANALPNLILGYFCNNILPLKVGEIVRTGLISRQAGIPFFTALSALVMERSMDILSLLVMALLTSFFLPLPEQLIVSVRVVGIALLALYLAVVAAALVHRKGGSGIERLATRLPARAGAWIVRTLDQLASGLRAFTSPGTLLATILYVALFWAVATTGWYLRLRAFGLTESFAVAPFVLLVVGLGVSIPSAPSYAGVYHACIVFALGTLGIDDHRSFPFSVFAHAVDFAFVGILGVTVMGAKSMSLGRLRDAARGR